MSEEKAMAGTSWDVARELVVNDTTTPVKYMTDEEIEQAMREAEQSGNA